MQCYYVLIYADALIYIAKWLVVVVVSSVHVVKPLSRLAGFALVDLIKNGCVLKVGVA